MFLANSAHQWYNIGWVDWVAVAGLPLTLAALLVTWRQARKATNAANAAERAVQHTEQQIRTKQLIVLVPQLRWVIDQLDTAIETADASLIRRTLDIWREQASYIHGILSAINPDDKAILKCLSKSRSIAATASNSLLKSDPNAVSDYIEARIAITVAYDTLNSWVGRNSTQALPPQVIEHPIDRTTGESG